MRKRDRAKSKLLRIAGYVRVSSQRQVTEGDSLAAQQSEIEQEVEFRTRREGWNVESLEFYIDAGRSAKDQNRPQLQRLKRDIAAGKIDLVICFKLDRITRSMKDFVDLWSLFEDHEVDVVSLREKFDTSMPTGEAMVQLIMVFAQLERKMTAERTYSIMRDRAERGLWNGGHVLGYRVGDEESGKLEIEEEGAAIVRQIFDSYEELGSAGAVCRLLSDQGIRYPTYKTRTEKVRGGNLFTKQKITGLLKNSVYIGHVCWGDVVREDCHPPIITKLQFERVQQQLVKNTKRRNNVRKPKGRQYLLSGLLRCGCGASMVGNSAHGRNKVHYYYQCTRQTHEAGKYSCNSPRIPAEALEEALISRIREIGSAVEDRQMIVDRAIACLNGESDRLKEQEDIIRRQHQRTKADISRLIEVLKSMGAKALKSVQGELTKLEEEEIALTSQLATLEKQQEPMERVSEDAKAFLETWADVGAIMDAATHDEKLQLLRHYIEVVELTADDPRGKSGTYAMRLFPEVCSDRGFDWSEEGIETIPVDSETQNGVRPKNELDAVESNVAELTESSSVRIVDQKAPPLGLEPRT